MAITIQERPGSPEITYKPPTQRAQYVVEGTTDETVAHAIALSGTPDIITHASGVLYKEDVRIKGTNSSSVWYADVTYAPRSRTIDTGSYRISFDTAGGTVHISQSKETVNKYPSATAPDYKGNIGVRGEEIDGTDIVIPALKIVVDFRHPSGVITLAKIKQLASYTGYVNSAPFLTFDAGEVLFLSARGSEGDASETEISYSFAMSQNATGLSIGDVTGITKKGWHIAWVANKSVTETVGSNKFKVTRPEFVYVERVYDEIDLRTILGFG